MKTGIQFLAVNAFFLLALGAENLADWLASLPGFRAACSALASGAESIISHLAR